jgi:hypothetical protein
MFYQSSYALFSTDKASPLGAVGGSDAPYAFSGKKATIERQDVAILGALRKWANKLFAEQDCCKAVDLNKASK